MYLVIFTFIHHFQRFHLSLPLPHSLLIYTAQTEDEMGVSANDKVMILQDLGDGWLRVRKGHEEGYVPQSYVEISG